MSDEVAAGAVSDGAAAAAVFDEVAAAAVSDGADQVPAKRVLELVLLVKAAQREIERRFNDALRPLGITAVQAEAVLVLGQSRPMSLKDLGSHLVAEAGHPSRLVDRLVAADLVERRVAGDDRRRVELSLTPRGREMEREIRRAREPLLEWGGRVLAGHDVAAGVAALRAVLDAEARGPATSSRVAPASAAADAAAAAARP